MHTEFDETEYAEWVEGIARANIENDGSSPEHVAEVCIVATAQMDGGVWFLLDAMPYTETRACPAAVLTGCGTYPFPPDASTDLRELAVDILATDIAEAMNTVQESPQTE
jgi:hypothetical protein